MKIVGAILALVLLAGCGDQGGEVDRSNRDPRAGYVYMYQTGYDFKVCDGNNLIYHSYDGGGRESLAVVEGSDQCGVG